MRSVATAAFGLAHADPVGCFVAATLVGRRFHKTFQQPRTQAITALKVRGHLCAAESQNPGCQIGATHTGTNQETVHIDHPLQMFATLAMVPSYPILAPLRMQSGTSKTQSAKPAVVGADQIAQLPAHQSTVL